MTKPILTLVLFLAVATFVAAWLVDRGEDAAQAYAGLERSEEPSAGEERALIAPPLQSVRLELASEAADGVEPPALGEAPEREASAGEGGILLRIEGQVRAQRDGQGIAGARIAFLGRRRLPGDSARLDAVGSAVEIAATSDAQGRYVLNARVDELGTEAAAQRPWILEASGTGYLSATRPLLEHALAPGAVARDVDLVLTAAGDAGALRGVLHDELARAIPDAEVRIQELTRFHWRLREEPEALLVRTGPDGSFRFDALRPGAYSVQIDRAGKSELVRAAVEVRSRDAGDLGILVVPALDVRCARVRGELRDAEERPLPGLSVKIGARETTTDERGAFDLTQIAPGRVTVEIALGAAYRAVARLTLEPSADLRLEAQLRIGTHRLGGLVTSSGAPLKGASLYTSYPLEACVVGLEPPALRFAQTFTARTGADGRFAFARLPSASSALYVEHRALAVDRTFDPPALDDEQLVLELAAGPLVEIHGTVRDRAGAVVRGAIVAPQRPSSDRERGVSDENGAYRLSLHLNANQGVGLHASHADHATADRWLLLEDARGTGRIAIDWSLVRGSELGTLVGRIAGTAGEWLDAYVVVTPEPEGGEEEWFAEVDVRGEFHLPGLPARTLVARFCALEREEIVRAVNIPANGVLRVEVELPPPVLRTRMLRLRDTAGNPVAGVAARLSGPSFATAFEGQSDAQGRLELALPLETDTITLRHERYAAHVLAVFAVTAEEPGAAEIPVTLRRGGERIAGSVLDRSGKPVPDVFVRLADAESLSAPIREVEFTRESGGFEFENLPVGEFLLEVKCPDGRIETRRVAAGNQSVEVRIDPA